MCIRDRNNTVNSTTTTTLSTRKLVLIALMTAITCIFAPMAIPIPVSPVPISLTNLVIMISIYVLGFKDATISYIVYLLLGLVGLPVFSGFTGGLGKLAGPTGGYLIGFIFLALISGLFVDKFPKNRILAVEMCIRDRTRVTMMPLQKITLITLMSRLATHRTIL